MLETLQGIASTLIKVILFSTSITILVTIIIQAIKRRVELKGELPKYIAITIGTILGIFVFLFGDIFYLPETWYAVMFRILLAFGISLASSEFYELLKGSSKKGTIAGIDEINEAAVLSLGTENEQQEG
jgi:hypothetical protein